MGLTIFAAVDPVLLSIIGGAFAAAIGYLTIVRKLSGRIQTTEAAQLWAEADKMRQEYREEIARMQGVIDRYEVRLKEIDGRNKGLADDNYKMTQTIATHERTIAELREQVNELSLENQRALAESDKLRQRVMELELNGRT